MFGIKAKHVICTLILIVMSLMAVSQVYLWGDMRDVWYNEAGLQSAISDAYIRIDEDISPAITKNFESDKKDRDFTIQQILSVKHYLAQMNREIKSKEPLIGKIVQDVIPSVVHISAYTDGGSWQGSGVIVREDGIVITAAHVIGTDPFTSFTVTMNNGKQYTTTGSCTVKGYDIGFLKISAENLPTSEFGDFENMEAGDPLFAIGSSFGYEHFNSVTKGILSSKHRSSDDWPNCSIPGWVELFQTDTSANSGNSGCPVYNLDGQIVGILVGNFTVVGGDNGISYCVPSTICLEYLESSIKALTIGSLVEVR